MLNKIHYGILAILKDHPDFEFLRLHQKLIPALLHSEKVVLFVPGDSHDGMAMSVYIKGGSPI